MKKVYIKNTELVVGKTYKFTFTKTFKSNEIHKIVSIDDNVLYVKSYCGDNHFIHLNSISRVKKITNINRQKSKNNKKTKQFIFLAGLGEIVSNIIEVVGDLVDVDFD